MADQFTKQTELMDYQQSLIQEFEVQFLKLTSEKKEKKGKIEVLRHYERNRRESWNCIVKNHRKLTKYPDLPDVYTDSFNSLIQTNEDFKNRLMAYARENSLSLEVIEDKNLDTSDEEESEEIEDEKSIHIYTPSTSDGKSKHTSKKGELISPSDHKGEDVSRPDNISEQKSPPKKTGLNQQQTYVPENSEDFKRNQNVPATSGNFLQNQNNARFTIHDSSSESSLNQSYVPVNTGDFNQSTNQGISNQQIPVDPGTFNQPTHGNQATNVQTSDGPSSSNSPPNQEAGIGSAMSAIVQLVSKQFELIQNQQETQVNTSTLIQEQFQAFQNQIAKNNAEKSSLKPQQLEIPTFKGDILEYKSFKEIFQKAISKVKWSDLEKLLLLQSKLSGRALERVKHLATEEQNYSVMWSILDKEFLITRALVQHNVSKLLQIQPVKANDVQAMRQFYSTLNTVVTNLTQLTDVQPAEWLFEIGYMQVESQIKRRYEDFLRAKELRANVETITEFLMAECNLAEGQSGIKTAVTHKIKDNSYDNSNNNKNKQNKSTRAHVTVNNENTVPPNNIDPEKKCFICKMSHLVNMCPTLMANENREKLLRHYKICIYCLKHKFNFRNPCRSKDTVKCEKCNLNHHTVLHPINNNASNTFVTNHQECQEFSHIAQQAETHGFVTKNGDTCTILPTAIANILDKNGMSIPIACLIDNCAERTYVSEDIVQKLGLRKYKTNIIIKGINDILDTAKSYVNLSIKLDDPKIGVITTQALVVTKIASNIPTLEIDMNMFGDKKMANPLLGKSCSVGILMGSDVLPQIFKAGGGTEITKSGLLLQDTHLGWIVSGKNSRPQKIVSSFVTYNESALKCLSDDKINERILKFFEVPEEIEECDDDEAKYCEELFEKKHYRTEDGRYVVPMIWKPNPVPLGHSYRKTLRFFLWQEQKWNKDPEHQQLNASFMREYLSMNHMTEIEKEKHADESGNCYYVPYLSIFRPNALSTRLRNVFNASAVTSNGKSLNDQLCSGPKLQNSIIEILTKARTFQVIVTADIAKMFRQILLLPEDCKKLRIIWREKPSDELREFQLETVTYGTECAPYQSLRTIQQCAVDNAQSETLAKIIKEAFYVDDFVYGADTVEECKELITQVTHTMAQGQFPLTKFMSNDPEVLREIPEEKKITSYAKDNVEKFKTLGLNYDPIRDEFSLNIQAPEKVIYTKRGVSSVVAKNYDPLNFILPYTMLLRIFLQQIWATKVDWDEELDETWKGKFDAVIQNMHKLADIKITRWLNTSSNGFLDLIGFSDASGLAKAAVIYARVQTNDIFNTHLVIAKGGVNKLKNAAVIASAQETIPKLELQALLILAELYQQIKNCFTHLNVQFRAYVDSKIIIYWMRSKTVNKNKYVQRRVEKIRKILDPYSIHYINTKLNPADIPSRSRMIDELLDENLWWEGPDFLKNSELPSTSDDDLNSSIPSTYITQNEEKEADMFAKFSSFNRLLRSVAYMRRWMQYKRTTDGVHTEFSANEVTMARKSIIKYYQHREMKDAMEKIRNKQLVPKGHFLRKLSPIIDKEGLLRVGGRLQNARFLSINQIQPIIIPKSHLLTLMVAYIHLKNFHAQYSLMQRLIIENYWIPALKSNIHRAISQCTSCTRWLSKPIQPEMAQLPEMRLKPANVFENTGTDLCGYFNIRASSLKFDRTMKAYIVIFICMVTKCVHLEVIKSLSTEEFLLAFSRFASRRSTPKCMHSDNGSNFIGCNRLLKDTWKSIQGEAKNSLALQEVDWKFIPRFAPSMGGLWESGIGALKSFLKRMENIKNLTIDEFQTIVCKIEYYLNSRPLYALGQKDLNNLSLTPFHFVLQRTGSIHPIETINSKLPLTTKWLQIVQLQKEFWKEFIREYLVTLQKKTKWTKPAKNLQINDVVIVKEPHLLPGQFKLAKITQVFPDPNGVVRKVQIEDAQKTKYTHAVNQLIPLQRELIQGHAIQLDKQQQTDTGKEIDAPVPLKQRLRSQRKITATQVLVTWLALMQVANAQITQLQPGIHTIELGNAQILSSAISVKVLTGINVLEDKTFILNKIGNFTHTCKHIAPEIHTYCDQWKKLLHYEAEQAFMTFESGFSTRKKRSWGWAAVKGFAVIAPHIITAGVMTYQQFEMNQLHDDLVNSQNKLLKATDIVNKITNEATAMSNAKIKEVKMIQNKIANQNQVQSDVQQISEIIALVTSKYLDLANMQPLDEVRKLLKKHKDIENLEIPELSDPMDLFSISTKEKLLQQGEIVIKYSIPMVSSTKYRKIAIISIPSTNRDIVKISKHSELCHKIIMDEENSTFGMINDLTHFYEDIYEDNRLQKVTECIKSLMKENATACDITKVKELQDEIIQLGEEILIINEKNDTSITCLKNDGNKTMNNQQLFAHLIKLPAACTIKTQRHMFSHPQEESISLASNISLDLRNIKIEYPKIILKNNLSMIEKQHHDVTSALTQQLESVLNSDQLQAFGNSITKQPWFMYAIWAALVITLIITGLCYKICKPKETTTRPESSFIKWSDLWASNHSTSINSPNYSN